MYSLKKKIGFITAVGLIFLIFGCAPQVHEHTHKFSDELTYDETNHWYAATCEHTEEKKDLAEHTFGEWEIAKEATEESEGSKKQVCSVCKYEKTETIDKLEHTHKFSDELTYDETNHWYAATCEHTEEKKDLAEHTFGEWEIKDEITLTRVCTECNFKEESINIESLKATNLPIVEINTVDNIAITSKEDWLEAKMEISNALEESWNFEAIDIEIRGRGNSTWGQPKKPYAIKLGKKQEICGMPKHKRWVLIANYLDNSFMKNSVAFYISEQLGMDYTVRGEFVNVVLNGKYIGLYWLGEQIKVDESRVNIDEAEDFLIEMDVYFDETWRFKSELKNLPYMIKNDDEMTQEKLDSLIQDINKLENALYGEDIINLQDYLDIESFAKFYIVNEIMANGELNHPKSSYFTFDSETKILSAGPVWDFDWAGATSSASFIIKNSIYYDRLFKDEDFCATVEELLDSENLTQSKIENKIEEMRNQISSSVALDNLIWGKHNNPVGNQFDTFDEYVDNLTQCIGTRINYLKNIDF